MLMQELASVSAEMKGKGQSSRWPECEGELDFCHVDSFGFAFYIVVIGMAAYSFIILTYHDLFKQVPVDVQLGCF